MKLSEIKNVNEWYIGNLSPMTIDEFEKFMPSAEKLPITIHYGQDDSAPHVHLWKHDLGAGYFALIFTYTRDKTETVFGGAMLTPVKAPHTKNIYQVSEINIPDDMQGKGFATNLYATLVVDMNIRLINSRQLSGKSEKLWMKLGSYSQNHFYKAIWDKKLDKEYPLSDIGKKTEDGVEILHPQKDDDRSVIDNKQRFFFMLTSTREAKTVEDCEKYFKTLTEQFNERQRFGESYFSTTYYLPGDE